MRWARRRALLARHRLLVALVALALLAGGCSSASDDSRRGPVRIGGFDFTESTVLATIYAAALEAKGMRAEVHADLGNRERVTPAMERGDIDLYPGYAASELEFLNGGAGEATADVATTVERLRTRLEGHGFTALKPSSAENTNVFVVTKATAEKHRLRRLSDLEPVAGQLLLGGPPECPSRPFCLAGLERVYGLRFKEFRALDAGGPASKDAVEKGEVDVALVFSSDGAVLARGLVVLEDDRQLQRAENVVPVVRKAVVGKKLTDAIDAVSAALTTADLGTLNKRAEDEDLSALAHAWLVTHGLAER